MNAFVAMDPAYAVEKQLQGTWLVTSGRWKCRLHFAAHHFALHFERGDIYLGVYTVDPTRNPGAMDMTIEEGPEEYRGLTALCLYHLDGDTLRWCGNEPGHDVRHAAFPPEGHGKFPTIVFRRDGI
jgi:uncharacterized protein (TIGR03067 family)